jgi:hypothetical protein
MTKGENSMQKITPFLWFDKEAGEAAKFYTSIFKDAKIIDTTTLLIRPRWRTRRPARLKSSRSSSLGKSSN